MIRALFAILLACSPGIAFAHGGASFESAEGAYFIDIGYDVPLMKGEETLLDLELYGMRSGKPEAEADFDDVTITLSSGATVHAMGTVAKPEFGHALLAIVPPASGNWSLGAEFKKGGSILATHVFPVTIAEPEHTMTISTRLIFGAIGLCLLGLSTVFFRRSA